MKKSIALISLVLAACTSTTLKNERRPQSLDEFSAKEISAIQELERIMKPHIVSLDREMITFRYESADGKFNPQTLAEVNDRETSWAVRFFNPDKVDGSDVGPGVYVAMDPTASTAWGAEDPHMFVIPIKAGSRILVGDELNVSDQETARGIQLKKDLSCWPDVQPSGYPMIELGQFVGSFRYSKNVQCRKIMIQVFQDLGIQALTYSYDSTTLRDCRNTGTAISIVDPNVINLGRMNYYSAAKTIEGDPQLTPFAKKAFHEGKKKFSSLSMQNTDEILQSFKNDFGFFKGVPVPSEKAYSAWKATNLYRCGPKWSLEVRPADDLAVTAINIYEDNDGDAEVRDLLMKTKFAYTKKMTTYIDDNSSQTFFQYGIKGLAVAEYEAINPRVTFEEFSKALAGFRFLDGSIKAAALLGEKFPYDNDKQEIELMNRALSKIPADQFKNPNLFAVVYQNLHLPPKSTILILNAMMVSGGYVPYLSGRLPKTLDEDVSAMRANDKAGYMRILKRCLDQYNDPAKAPAEIAKGACGIRPN